jgi:hypothetical protein
VKNAAKRPHGRLRLTDSQEPCHGLGTHQAIVFLSKIDGKRSFEAMSPPKHWAIQMYAKAAGSLFFEQIVGSV